MGLTDYYGLKEKVNEYHQELKDLKPEKENLAEQVAQLMQEKTIFEEMARRYDTLLEIMTDWRMGASEDNPVEARAYIEDEITEYAAILSDD